MTPNGYLSGESADLAVTFEGYLTRQVIEEGTYVLYANLYADPQNHQPVYDLAFRLGQASAFGLLYGDNAHRLSTAVSWLSDPTPTFPEVNANAYTDLRGVATYTVPPAPNVQPDVTSADAATAVTMLRTARLTSAQLERVRVEWPSRKPQGSSLHSAVPQVRGLPSMPKP